MPKSSTQLLVVTRCCVPKTQNNIRSDKQLFRRSVTLQSSSLCIIDFLSSLNNSLNPTLSFTLIVRKFKKIGKGVCHVGLQKQMGQNYPISNEIVDWTPQNDGWYFCAITDKIILLYELRHSVRQAYLIYHWIICSHNFQYDGITLVKNVIILSLTNPWLITL